MRGFLLAGLVAGLSLAGCQRGSVQPSAADLVRTGAPEACSHADVQAALGVETSGGAAAEEITFSGFDQARLRVQCEGVVAGRRVSFEVAPNLAQPGAVAVIVTSAVGPDAPGESTVPSLQGRAGAAETSTPAVAAGYTYDVPRTYPRAFALWRQQVRELPLEGRAWAQTLAGTAAPVDVVSVADASYLKGWVCEPHNCGGNEALLLIKPDQTRVLGLIRLTGPDRQIVEHWVGGPSPLEARCLTFYMDDRSEAGRCP